MSLKENFEKMADSIPEPMDTGYLKEIVKLPPEERFAAIENKLSNWRQKVVQNIQDNINELIIELKKDQVEQKVDQQKEKLKEMQKKKEKKNK